MTPLALVVMYFGIGVALGAFAAARERWLFSANAIDAFEIWIICAILWPVLMMLGIYGMIEGRTKD